MTSSDLHNSHICISCGSQQVCWCWICPHIKAFIWSPLSPCSCKRPNAIIITLQKAAINLCAHRIIWLRLCRARGEKVAARIRNDFLLIYITRPATRHSHTMHSSDTTRWAAALAQTCNFTLLIDSVRFTIF
jgi:hypothetical protein